jgi:hypothetical protein
MAAPFVMLALVPALFAPAAGWHTGHQAAHACPGVSTARCVEAHSWAATVAWRDCGACLPHATLATLPADGVALQVTVSHERSPLANRALTWPPVVDPRRVEGLEGLPARIGVYQRVIERGAESVYVLAYFGRARPTAPQLRRADAELARAHGDQRDRDDSLHIDHVGRVSEAVPAGDGYRRVAWLHDVLEDTEVTEAELATLLPEPEWQAVRLLTHDVGVPYLGYVACIAGAPGEAGELARAVKQADMLDNLRRCLLAHDPAVGQYGSGLALLWE